VANDTTNQLVVEIVLDDGSISKGILNIKKTVEGVAKDSSKQLSTVGDALEFNIADRFKNAISEIPLRFAAIAGSVAVVGAAIKQAFDLSIDGEKLNALDKQFDNIASGAGIVGSELRRGLEEASDGLVSTNDLLEKANSAIINLGSSASKLPEILTLARTATLALGGTVEERFNQLVSGIESGNAKALKNAGIILDTEKAYKEYAKTLGVTAGELTKSQQQQALLNAVLTEGEKKFKDVDKSVQPISDNLKRINVALQDSKEAFAQFVNSKFGDIFANITEKIADLLRTTNELKNVSAFQQQARDAADLRASLFQTEANIESLKKKIADLSSIKNPEFDVVLKLTKLRAELVETEKKLPVLQTKFEGLSSAISIKPNVVSDPLGLKTQTEQVSRLTQEQLLAIQSRNDQVVKLQLQAQQDFITFQQSQLPVIETEELKIAELKRIAREQELLNIQNYELQKREIESQYSTEKGFSEAQRLTALDALDQQFGTKQIANRQNTLNEIKKVEEASNKQRLQGFSGFFGNLATLTQTSSREFFEIGKAAAIAQATIDGYAAVQGAYKQGSIIGGPPLGAAFATAAAIAAAVNISRIAATNFGDQGSPSGVGSGSTPTAGSDLNQITPSENLQRATEERIVLNVNGDILGDESSGRKLVELINSAFDTSGVELRQGLV